MSILIKAFEILAPERVKAFAIKKENRKIKKTNNLMFICTTSKVRADNFNGGWFLSQFCDVISLFQGK